LLDEVLQFGFGCGGAAGQRDRGAYFFAEDIVGDADDRCLGDRWMRVEHLFDLAGIHVVAAAN